ncbi:MAG TPA: DUF2911 domain-containing protein [Terriglobales bacterium]|nr:DUF2911 domain-containing protein [Terriglobales bacterium]
MQILAVTRFQFHSLAVASALLLPTGLLAQAVPELPQASPLSRVEQRVGLTDLAIEYSSPAVKNRTIWGTLVPYGQLWRTGANAATRLEASRDFRFGGKPVPAGQYALYTIPAADSWTVILNSNAKASGTNGYDEKNDVARITVKPEKAAAKRERMTFLFSDTTDTGTRLDLEWNTLRVSVPIEVDTRAQALANIEKSLGEAWRPHFASARYLLDSGGDLNQALGYIDTSISIKPTWWNNWIRAQILAKQGKNQEAVAAAQQAQSLGAGDQVFEGFFKGEVAKSIETWGRGQ